MQLWVLIIGFISTLFSGFFVVRHIRILVESKKTASNIRFSEWFDLLTGFSTLYIWFPILCLGIVLILGGLGVVRLKIS